MRKSKEFTIRIVLVIGLIIAISFFFDASFYLSLVIVAVLAGFGEIVHMPENMPDAVDNPDGKELHPMKAIFISLCIVLALVSLGVLFPELYNYGFRKNS